MRPLLQRLAAGDPLVGDGAMGTMLFERGLPPGEPPETVALTRPAVLEEVHRLYVEAGAELLETDTFGASPLKLALHGIGSDMVAMNREAVRVARRAAGDRAYVAGSCGPSGRVLEPYGDATEAEVLESFRRQAEVLAAAGVDCIVVETMTDVREAVLAVRAAKSVAPALPVLATATFDPMPQGYHTIFGSSVAAAAQALADAGADAVGSNCGLGVAHLVAIAREFRAATRLPVVIQPNAGMPRTVGGRTVYDETPEVLATHARELVDIGVALIGGCCGTTPEHIRALRAMVDASPRRRA